MVFWVAFSYRIHPKISKSIFNVKIPLSWTNRTHFYVLTQHRFVRISLKIYEKKFVIHKNFFFSLLYIIFSWHWHWYWFLYFFCYEVRTRWYIYRLGWIIVYCYYHRQTLGLSVFFIRTSLNITLWFDSWGMTSSQYRMKMQLYSSNLHYLQ